MKDKCYGKMLIFSAPSGAGKSTIVQHLMDKYPFMGFSVSATSRQPRGGERDGIEYHFITADRFKEGIRNGFFLEYEEVYENCYYGTLRSEVEKIWAQGKVAIFDIDVIGGIRLKELYGDNALSVFIMPPSIEVLKQRLIARGTDTPESIDKRIRKAQEEISRAHKFDIVLINDTLAHCKAEIEQIVEEYYILIR